MKNLASKVFNLSISNLSERQRHVVESDFLTDSIAAFVFNDDYEKESILILLVVRTDDKTISLITTGFDSTYDTEARH